MLFCHKIPPYNPLHSYYPSYKKIKKSKTCSSRDLDKIIYYTILWKLSLKAYLLYNSNNLI